MTFELRGASTSVPGTSPAPSPRRSSLTLGTIGPLGPFVPGVGTDYTTTMAATVTSTGEDAALSVLDPSSTATGRLVNGTHALAAPLQISADGGAFAPLRTDNGPLALAAWNTPITNARRAARLQADDRCDGGSAHRLLRQDADVHAVDDEPVVR